MSRVDHIEGRTFHGRRGDIENRFVYSVDYVLLDADDPVPQAPWPFRRNRAGLISLRDRDHGGAPGNGRGADWVRDILTEEGLDHLAHRIELLAQPRILGHVFNPVSFWLIRDRDVALRAVIAEVTNTFGDRHNYLCHRPDLAPLQPSDEIVAKKVFHVSPFQDIGGVYRFRFDIREEKISIRIDFDHENKGLLATLVGDRRPATRGGLLRALLRRPFGSRRVLALIHWQALVLWRKRAGYRTRPEPPEHSLTRIGK
ncbi:DUF1365 domain-containing protein [Palleronia caenipelagi]|uniref:DUF1365 domain-containing protein n=1 Tax=Palleronia caenipelagi TaxID=2489174 RepID=A0A547Q797_9RHOB|nr:DUF1365 domain-containing protein [Palleronia caenipelagi]TRD22258.1 DUF1365 domain-containing protein [Palleronia caenipelagi]